eukprot:scaffold67906_cov24-Cyclotella_meneghiniana.AAC.2
MGQLLQSKHDAPFSMAPFFLHWVEEAIWNAWSKLPEFVVGKDIQQILKRRLIHHFKYDPHLIEQMELAELAYHTMSGEEHEEETEKKHKRVKMKK